MVAHASGKGYRSPNRKIIGPINRLPGRITNRAFAVANCIGRIGGAQHKEETMEVAIEKIVNRDGITDTALSLFAGDDSIDIPESYIRTDEVLADEVVGKDEAYELPVIDMAKLLDPDSSAMETEKLGSACRHWGFFQVWSRVISIVLECAVV